MNVPKEIVLRDGDEKTTNAAPISTPSSEHRRCGKTLDADEVTESTVALSPDRDSTTGIIHFHGDGTPIKREDGCGSNNTLAISSIPPLPHAHGRSDNEHHKSKKVDEEGDSVKSNKKDYIRRKLRAKEKRLSDNVKAATENDSMLVTLSEAAFSLKQRLIRKTAELAELQQRQVSLEAALETSELEKSSLQRELGMMRQSMQDGDGYDDKSEGAGSSDTDDGKQQSPFRNSVDRDKTLRALEKQLVDAHEEVEWLKKEMSTKAEQLEYLEYALLAKNKEIDELCLENNDKTRRIVELEVDLETHDCRFASTLKKRDAAEKPNDAGIESEAESSKVKASQSFDSEVSQEPKPSGLGRLLPFRRSGSMRGLRWSSLHGIRSRSEHGSKPTSNGGGAGESKAYADRLRSDLISLEARYKRDRYRAKTRYEQLKYQNEEFLLRIIELQEELREERGYQHGEEVVAENIGQLGASTETKPAKLQWAEQKVRSLENERHLNRREIDTLQEEIGKVQDYAKRKARFDKMSIATLQMENKRQSIRILELEKQSDEAPEAKQAADELEVKVKELTQELHRLQEESIVKDERIDALRVALVDHRMTTKAPRNSTRPENTEDGSASSFLQTEGDASTASASKHSIGTEDSQKNFPLRYAL